MALSHCVDIQLDHGQLGHIAHYTEREDLAAKNIPVAQYEYDGKEYKQPDKYAPRPRHGGVRFLLDRLIRTLGRLRFEENRPFCESSAIFGTSKP